MTGFYLNVSSGVCVADCGEKYYGKEITVNGSVNRECVRCADLLCKYCTVNGCK